jgi:hypothetical protein
MREAKGAITEPGSTPHWDWDPVVRSWIWAKPAPPSQASGRSADPAKAARKKVRMAMLLTVSKQVCLQFANTPVSQISGFCINPSTRCMHGGALAVHWSFCMSCCAAVVLDPK